MRAASGFARSVGAAVWGGGARGAKARGAASPRVAARLGRAARRLGQAAAALPQAAGRLARGADPRRARRRRPGELPDELLGRIEEVDWARREWLVAQRYFDCVSEPELVEEAVHRILAAERRFAYLLRRAREDGVPTGARLAVLPRVPPP